MGCGRAHIVVHFSSFFFLGFLFHHFIHFFVSRRFSVRMLFVVPCCEGGSESYPSVCARLCNRPADAKEAVFKYLFSVRVRVSLCDCIFVVVESFFFLLIFLFENKQTKKTPFASIILPPPRNNWPRLEFTKENNIAA